MAPAAGTKMPSHGAALRMPQPAGGNRNRISMDDHYLNNSINKTTMPSTTSLNLSDTERQTSFFFRKTIKFLVPNETLHVLNRGLLKHLRVSPFLLPTGEVLTTQENHSSYFDNDSLSLYHARVAKEEGATAIRLRWYGNSLQQSTLFVERKVHHEEISGEKSNKKRFSIPVDEAGLYLEGGCIHPCAEDYDARSSELPEQVQKVILEQRLRPMVHTLYDRTSYIMDGDDDVRITLDENVRIYRERGNWADIVRSDGKPFGQPIVMPFHIIEVKLKGSHSSSELLLPEWLRTLLYKKVFAVKLKISKFNYGCAMLIPHQCRILPVWIGFVQNPFEGVELPKAPQEISNSVITIDSDVGSYTSDDYLKENNHSKGQNPEKSTQHWSSKLKEAAFNTFDRITPCNIKSSKKQTQLRTAAKQSNWDPKAFMANERTFYHWIRFALTLALFTIGLGELGVIDTQIKTLSVLILCDLMILYSVVMFHMRRVGLLNTLLNPEKVHTAFNDRIGNTVLAVIVFTFVTIYCIMILVNGPEFHNGNYLRMS